VPATPSLPPPRQQPPPAAAPVEPVPAAGGGSGGAGLDASPAPGAGGDAAEPLQQPLATAGQPAPPRCRQRSSPVHLQRLVCSAACVLTRQPDMHITCCPLARSIVPIRHETARTSPMLSSHRMPPAFITAACTPCTNACRSTIDHKVLHVECAGLQTQPQLNTAPQMQPPLQRNISAPARRQRPWSQAAAPRLQPAGGWCKRRAPAAARRGRHSNALPWSRQ
jgi:hypothetical protein